MAKRKIDEEEPHVVKDYYIGHTHVLICDNAYRNRTQEEIDETWRKVAEIAQKALTIAYYAGTFKNDGSTEEDTEIPPAFAGK